MSRLLDELKVILRFSGQTGDMDRMAGKVDTLRGKVDGLADRAQRIGLVGVAAAGAIGRTILGFERQMNAISAVYTAQGEFTQEQRLMLEAQAKELGRTTSKSASEAAAAQLEMARAGFDVNQVMAATPDILNLAIAAELDMADAAAIVMSQLRIYNLEADKSNRITDVLSLTAAKAMTTVGALRYALQPSASIASTLNVPLERLNAMLGTLANRGFDASQSGTAVRNMLMRLGKDMPQITGVFKDLGIDKNVVVDLLNQGRIFDILEMLNERGLNTQQAFKLFGAYSGGAGIQLVRNVPALREFESELMNAAGATDIMRQEISSGLNRSWNIAKSTFESMQLSLGDGGLTGKISMLLDMGSKFFNWIGALPDPVKNVISWLLAGAAALLVVSIGLRAVSVGLSLFSALLRLKAIPAMVLWLISKTKNIAADSTMLFLRAQLLALTIRDTIATKANAVGRFMLAAATGFTLAPLWAAVAATWAWTAALLANPATWIVLGIIALAAALALAVYAIWKFRDAIWSGLKSAFNWMKQNWPLLAGILFGPFGLALALLWKFRHDVLRIMSDVWSTIQDTWNRITGFVGGIIDWIDGKIAQAIQFIADIPGKAAGLLPGWLKTGIEAASFGAIDFPDRASASETQHNYDQRRTSFEIGQLNQQITADDPAQIAAGTREALETEFSGAAVALDSGIAR